CFRLVIRYRGQWHEQDADQDCREQGAQLEGDPARPSYPAFGSGCRSHPLFFRHCTVHGSAPSVCALAGISLSYPNGTCALCLLFGGFQIRWRRLISFSPRAASAVDDVTRATTGRYESAPATSSTSNPSPLTR